MRPTGHHLSFYSFLMQKDTRICLLYVPTNSNWARNAFNGIQPSQSHLEIWLLNISVVFLLSDTNHLAFHAFIIKSDTGLCLLHMLSSFNWARNAFSGVLPSQTQQNWLGNDCDFPSTLDQSLIIIFASLHKKEIAPLSILALSTIWITSDLLKERNDQERVKTSFQRVFAGVTILNRVQPSACATFFFRPLTTWKFCAMMAHF